MKTQRNKNRKDIYQTVTDLIIEKLEKGIVPWKQNWSDQGAPANYVTKKEYRGINLWILISLKHNVPYYLTFKQASGLGGKIKKGSKGLPVCYWNYTFIHKVTGKRLSQEEAITVLPENLEKSAYLKYYTVFNVADIEGIDYNFPEMDNSCKATTIEKCEQIIKEMLLPPRIQSVKNFPYYSPKRDFINMPEM
ncbi:MAG TPA: ArdC-like ssDNA-binding domain-containing protein, partial [Anditalea sp.]|nr:ArdC-like ssDNA-binding domain-containing protein [Anditalea sp.]